MRTVKCLFLALLLCACGGCGAMNYNIHRDLDVAPSNLEKINNLYDPWIEKGFCVGRGEVYNILVGGVMSSPVPICRRTDIVMHTHPTWAEKVANWIDIYAWDEYYKRYRGWRFGIMLGPNDFILYDRKDDR